YPSGRKDEALGREIASYRKEFRESNAEHVRDAAYPMRPERILAAVREVLPRDALITTDVGWNKNGVGQQFPVLTPGTIFTTGGHWNINDIYSPGREASHVAIEYVPGSRRGEER